MAAVPPRSNRFRKSITAFSTFDFNLLNALLLGTGAVHGRHAARFAPSIPFNLVVCNP
jgi:hypothetical protein